MNQVIVKLKGGLGNQMFQYAFARSLEAKSKEYGKQVSVTFDRSFYDGPAGGDTPRELLIDSMNTMLSYATREDVICARGGWLTRMKSKLIGRIRGPHIAYNPRELTPPFRDYYEGYWQAVQYLVPIENILRAEFTLKSPFSSASSKIAELLRSDEHSTSIFYRRTDYVGHKDLDIGEDFQRRAIERLRELDPAARLYVFSDDIEWVKTNEGLPIDTVYVSSPEITFPEEMHLMSLAKHHIVPNSTFAWWGAWLDPNPDKIVIAPKIWSNTHNNDWYRDIVPTGWVRT